MLKELKISTPQEMGPYLCSKWTYHYFLVDCDELKDLLTQLGTSYIFPIGKILRNCDLNLVSEMVDAYYNVIEQLKREKVGIGLLKEKLPLAISRSLDTFYLHSPKPKAYCVKITKPVLQLQLGSFRYSMVDETIRLNSIGVDSVFWGFKLFYPQIFQDNKTDEIFKIDASFANYPCFSLTRKWMRDKTLPVRFIINQKKIVTTLRIGKKCLPWIHLHPQLKALGCEIDHYAH